jgi:Coenzyme PQQ synthesis protein D (PqqD)
MVNSRSFGPANTILIQILAFSTIGGSMRITETGMPLARKTDLVVKEVGGELLVYDLERDQAHCLNDTAALVWKHCDGKKDAAAIATQLEKKLKTSIDESVIWYALSQLSKDHLLEHPVASPPVFAGMNRRQMMRALGVAAVVAVPVVTSIVAPTPAQAVSCLPAGQPCTASAQCCSGFCNPGTGTCA